jgi:hypothetical protein
VAIPLSGMGIQLATSRLAVGNITASPAPRQNRTAINSGTAMLKRPGARPVTAVHTLHQRMPKVRTRLGPKRSAILPEGA